MKIGINIHENCTVIHPKGYKDSVSLDNEEPYVWRRETAESDGVVICGISPKPKGRFVLPSMLDGLPVIRICDNAFRGCDELTDIEIQSCVAIGEFAFMECVSLKAVVLPEHLTEIGNEAFRGCYRLEHIMIPNGVKRLGYSTFEGCSSLNCVILPRGIEVLPYRLFAGCSSLKAVEIQKSVKCVESMAFEGCTALKEITFPKKLDRIERAVFYGCERLKIVRFLGDAPKDVYIKKEDEDIEVDFTENANIFEETPDNLSVCISKYSSGWGSGRADSNSGQTPDKWPCGSFPFSGYGRRLIRGYGGPSAFIKMFRDGIAYLKKSYPEQAITLDDRNLLSLFSKIMQEAMYQVEFVYTAKSETYVLLPGGAKKRIHISTVYDHYAYFPCTFTPDLYLAIKVFPDGEIEEIYNGPGEKILPLMKDFIIGPCHFFYVNIPRLVALAEEVPISQRVPRKPSTSLLSTIKHN